MDFFELNKLLGALLGALFIVFSVSLISDTIFYSPTPATPGYVIEVPEQEVADEGPVEEGPNVLALIAEGDVEAGEAAFRRCTSCHTPEEGGANRVGPNLWNTVMQPIANAEGFNYSSGMRDFAAEAETWTYEHLAGFLESPRDYVPGTTMSFAGIRDVQEKANLIAFLRTLSSDPAPLPEVEEVSAEEEAVAPEGGEAAPADGEAAPEDGEAAPADSEAVPADGDAVTEEDDTVGGDESGTPAEPVEPTPSTDGTEASPETDAGVPASDSATDEPNEGEQTVAPAADELPETGEPAPVEPETGEAEFAEPETGEPAADEPEAQVDEEIEEELQQ